MYVLFIVLWLALLFAGMVVSNAGRTRWQYWLGNVSVALWAAIMVVEPLVYGPSELLTWTLWGLFILGIVSLFVGTVVGSFWRMPRPYQKAPSKRQIEAGFY